MSDTRYPTRMHEAPGLDSIRPEKRAENGTVEV